ncbi:Ppx/GppA family phosphatase [Sphingobium sufflavum]|uniref:Ppx/GppA family phosphatase n=1 Tax=Sphingobium sufflavum TaxID=1129547 RepID=UPI001F1789D9|nr:Ppx/GppA family phosphatase [Sphingobium sufflavum]MCE7797427.1 Ppx/GppA family phosphatase [Sphingobium sufflavum]
MRDQVLDPFHRIAIIDIGSNSVRLVVYDGPRRIPFTLFNEKILAGLGADIGTTGRIGQAAMERGLRALIRFQRLCRDMEVTDIRCVATAAVREASNGPEFVARVQEIGLPVRILSGEEEGHTSAAGLVSGMPDADGIMGDLGGGSLELVRIRGGQVLQSVSIPLGVLRVREVRARGKGTLARTLSAMLTAAGWQEEDAGLPFYMVGGSWRSLARLDMHLRAYPLPIFHNYELTPARIPTLSRTLTTMDKAAIKALPYMSGGRIPTLPDAAALLGEVITRLGSSKLVVSSYGLREGLLYQDLPQDVSAQDPLLVATRAEGDAQGRFLGHGDLIERWTAPLFADDPAPLRRIRHAACLLADVGWRANPDFRAERGLETALHGNWVGITAPERAMLAQALYTSLGGGDAATAELQKLATTEQLARAAQWGLAIRMAQRLSGGVASALNSVSVALDRATILLRVPATDADLLGEAAERRLRQLAQGMGRDYRIERLA